MPLHARDVYERMSEPSPTLIEEFLKAVREPLSVAVPTVRELLLRHHVSLQSTTVALLTFLAAHHHYLANAPVSKLKLVGDLADIEHSLMKHNREKYELYQLVVAWKRVRM